MKMLDKPLELSLVVKGEIVKSNLSDFEKSAELLMAGINNTPETEAEYAKAKKDIAKLKESEDICSKANDYILSQRGDINDALECVNYHRGEFRDVRLELNRITKADDASKKSLIIEDGINLIKCDWRDVYRSKIMESMKGKSNLENMRSGVEDVAKAINYRHDVNREVINAATLKHGASIAPDHRQLLDMTTDALRDQIDRRVELKAAEDERKRLDIKRKEAEAGLAEMKRVEAKEKEADKQEDERYSHPSEVESIQTSHPLVNTCEISESDELKMWKVTAIRVLGELKKTNVTLKHDSNISAVTVFSTRVNQAWKEAF